MESAYYKIEELNNFRNLGAEIFNINNKVFFADFPKEGRFGKVSQKPKNHIEVFNYLNMDFFYTGSSILYGLPYTSPRTMNTVYFLIDDESYKYEVKHQKIITDSSEFNLAKSFKNPKEYYFYKFLINNYGVLMRESSLSKIDRLLKIYFELRGSGKLSENFYYILKQDAGIKVFNAIVSFESILFENINFLNGDRIGDDKFWRNLNKFGINYRKLG